MLFVASANFLVLFHGTAVAIQVLIAPESTTPPPPKREPIEVDTLPLPPATPSLDLGSCTSDINPHGTGCVLQTGGLVQGGGFLPDGKHVLARVNFTGAPAAPGTASVYSGDNLIIVKTDGTTFPNGDAWKCVTCGVLDTTLQHKLLALDYPQAFRDGKRVLAGANVIECGGFDLTSEECTPTNTHIVPIRWDTSPDGHGRGGAICEQRLHPDNVHIGFSSFATTAGKLDQHSYLARLQFNNAPTSGEPLAPRFDLVNVTILANKAPESAPITMEGDQLRINYSAVTVGELRGFSGTGKEVTYIGYPAESSNIDVFAVELSTGAVRRITSHPEYCDPLDISPDDEWAVIMDTRGSNRQMFMAGMRHIPPIIDMISTTVAASTRNNGERRFFQPYLIDKHGDRGPYFGQKLNEEGDESPGAINDREWNGMADPKWSLDGTKIVYWQAMTVPPACGGENPLPCQGSTEDGGRTERLMIAHLISRKPLEMKEVAPIPDTVSWGTPYSPGMNLPARHYPPEGTYTLSGAASGSAHVTITEEADHTSIQSIAVEYTNFSDDRRNFLNGFENFTLENPSITLNRIRWFSDLTMEGDVIATKKTSEEGFRLEVDVVKNVLKANGTLKTTVNGDEYQQPANGS